MAKLPSGTSYVSVYMSVQEKEKLDQMRVRSGGRPMSEFLKNLLLNQAAESRKEKIYVSKDLLEKIRAKWKEECQGDQKPLSFPDFISLLLWLYATGFISQKMKTGISPKQLASIQQESSGGVRVARTTPPKFSGDVELAFPDRSEAL